MSQSHHKHHHHHQQHPEPSHGPHTTETTGSCIPTGMQVTSVAGGYQLTVNGSISNPPASMSVGFTDQNGSPISAFSVTNNNLAMNKAYVSADTFGAHVSNGNITQNIISLQPNASFAGTTVTITPFDSSGNAYPQFAVQINL